MSSVGFPIFVVTTLIAGTAAAIVLTPRDILRSTVVEAPARTYLADTPAVTARPQLPAAEPAAVVQMASLTVEVTPLAAPSLSVAPQPETRDIRHITAGVLNMRAEPNKESGLIASLPRGTAVEVTDTSGSWAYVTTTDGTSGWLSQNFLTPTAD